MASTSISNLSARSLATDSHRSRFRSTMWLAASTRARRSTSCSTRTRRTTNCSGGDLETSDVYAPDHHWGDRPIDINAHDLPALKARYLIAGLPEEGRVLEIGCGGGRIMNTIAANRPGLALDGCDIRPLATPSSTFRFTELEPSCVDLPYEAETFDAVVLFDVLEHLLDPATMVKADRSVMRTGGMVVSFTPLEGQPFSVYRLYRRILGDDLYVDTKEHLQAFSEKALLTLFESDFCIANIEYAYHAFGHLMDATLFALLKIPAMRKRFWKSNPYYRESSSGSDDESVIGSLMRVANGLAYAESRLLRHTRLGAAGMLFTATAR